MKKRNRTDQLSGNEKELLAEAQRVFERPINGVRWGAVNDKGNRDNGWFTPL